MKRAFDQEKFNYLQEVVRTVEVKARDGWSYRIDIVLIHRPEGSAFKAIWTFLGGNFLGNPHPPSPDSYLHPGRMAEEEDEGNVRERLIERLRRNQRHAAERCWKLLSSRKVVEGPDADVVLEAALALLADIIEPID